MKLYMHCNYFKNNYTQITITSKTVYEPWHSYQMTQTKFKLVKIKFKKDQKCLLSQVSYWSSGNYKHRMPARNTFLFTEKCKSKA